jgi:tetratricopeptide (TPR) repeat protein
MRRRIWACAAILALVALSLPALSAPPLDVSEISAALAAGDGARALTLTNAALSQVGLDDADHARLLVDRAFARQLQGDSDNALVDLTQAIEAHSLTDIEQSRAYLERGLILDGLGRLNDAIGDYGAVLRLDPLSAIAMNNRAMDYWRQNRFADARQDYLASIAAGNPAPEYSYYGLGQVAESEGKSEEARGFYAKAVAANPSYRLAQDRLTALRVASAAQANAPPPKNVTAPTPAPPPSSADSSAAKPPPPIRPARDQVAKAEPSPAPDSAGGAEVQLGAWHEKSLATEGWKQAVARAGGALSGLSPHIVAVDLPGKGRYYRLRVPARDGRQLCATLTAKGLACTPVSKSAD